MFFLMNLGGANLGECCNGSLYFGSCLKVGVPYLAMAFYLIGRNSL
jgi:hypothetical protein